LPRRPELRSAPVAGCRRYGDAGERRGGRLGDLPFDLVRAFAGHGRLRVKRGIADAVALGAGEHQVQDDHLDLARIGERMPQVGGQGRV
jgi:hypothetical protein